MKYYEGAEQNISVGLDPDQEIVKPKLKEGEVELGDRERKECLYKEYHNDLYRYALKLTQNNDDLAQDIVQDTWTKIFSNLKTYEERSQFIRWAFFILKNIFLNHIKRKETIAIKNGVHLDDGTVILPDESQLNPEDSVLAVERQDWMNKALETLTPKQREILVLRELEHLSYEELTKRLGITRPAMASRLRDARQKFRVAYDELSKK